MHQEDVHWMQLALKEGELGRFYAAPNPSVGCVLVRDGREISRGHTQPPGGNHAEIEAIEVAKRSGISVRGSTAYVTLEPCSHQGRTPPCARRLLDEGIARVVYAVDDPNPLVHGAGAKILRDGGVEVEAGVCEKEARSAHAGFFSRIVRERPWVRMKVAVTLDGRTALENGQSKWITAEAARSDAHLYRARAQGLLTGIGTILADNPTMNVRLSGGFPSPVKYVIDPRAETPTNAALLSGKKTVLFVSETVSEKKIQQLVCAGTEVVPFSVDQNGHFNLQDVLKEIGRRGVNELHVEAGANLNGALLSAGLVDELLVYMAPALMGKGLALADFAPKTSMDAVDRWEFDSVCRIGADIRLILKKS